MYSNMVTLQIMDTIFYEAQRQGRISFYATTIGEEAINIASAAALTIDDFVFPQVLILLLYFWLLIINCMYASLDLHSWVLLISLNFLG